MQQQNSLAALWQVDHPCTTQDQASMAAMRPIVEPNKGKLQGIAARGPFDEIMSHVAPPDGVHYEADRIGGISGWWCRPQSAPADRAVMHIHGGWFSWGTAEAFRHFAGHIAASAQTPAFVPDYRLAPEHPFHAAPDDVHACYAGLIAKGVKRIAITGDSAGGNLACGLLVRLARSKDASSNSPVAGVALSPVTDLTLSGDSWSTRAAADPYFTKAQAASLVQAYLNGHDRQDPSASPLYADLAGIAPLRVHVGNEEVLLDDSVQLVRRAVSAGVDAKLHVWHGMAHGFLGGIGRMEAAQASLTMIGQFLRDRLTATGG